MSLAAAPIAAVSKGWAGGPRRLLVSFFGLFGVGGPLPLHLTAFARERLHKDPVFIHFVDLFHHRLLSILYRVWANGQPAVSHDQMALGQDHFAMALASLAGARRAASAVTSDSAALHCAGLMGSHARSAAALEAIVEATFAVPARVDEFVGEWLEIPVSLRWQLGRGAGQNQGRLGESTAVGARSFQAQHRFRLVVGPMDTARYVALLPGAVERAALDRLVGSFAGPHLCADVRLAAKPSDEEGLGRGLFLGWTYQLGSRAAQNRHPLTHTSPVRPFAKPRRSSPTDRTNASMSRPIPSSA